MTHSCAIDFANQLNLQTLSGQLWGDRHTTPLRYFDVTHFHKCDVPVLIVSQSDTLRRNFELRQGCHEFPWSDGVERSRNRLFDRFVPGQSLNVDCVDVNYQTSCQYERKKRAFDTDFSETTLHARCLSKLISKWLLVFTSAASYPFVKTSFVVIRVKKCFDSRRMARRAEDAASQHLVAVCTACTSASCYAKNISIPVWYSNVRFVQSDRIFTNKCPKTTAFGALWSWRHNESTNFTSRKWWYFT